MRSRFESLRDGLLASVREGLTLEDAATRAGVSVNTVRGWVRESREAPDGRFGAFAAAVDTAREQAQAVADGPLDLDELSELVAKAARGGSVQAMKLGWEILRGQPQDPAKPTDALSAVDELAARRAREAAGS